MKNLIPRRRKEGTSPVSNDAHPLEVLQHRMNHLFDDFFDDFGVSGDLSPFGNRWPAASGPGFEVKETEDEVVVKAELPGMDEKDIDIWLDEDHLTLRGEKKEEREEKKHNTRVSEISYGSFQRTIPLPAGIDRDGVASKFKRGVLTLTLPRTEEAKNRRRRIPVSSDDT